MAKIRANMNISSGGGNCKPVTREYPINGYGGTWNITFDELTQIDSVVATFQGAVTAYAYFDENDAYKTLSTTNGALYLRSISGNVINITADAGYALYYKLQIFAYGS